MTKLTFLVQRKKITHFLLITVIALSLISLALKTFQQVIGGDFATLNAIAWIFDVDRERNLPAIYSSATLLLCGVILAFIALAKKVERNRYFPHWAILSAIFVYLAWDEAVEFHEQLMNAPILYDLLDQLGLQREGILNFPWVVFAFPIVFLVGLFYLKFFLNLPFEQKQLFLIAASLYLFGALGMELAGGLAKEYFTQDSLIYVLSTAVEEFFEMLGIVVFINVLLLCLTSAVEAVHIDLEKQTQMQLSNSFVANDRSNQI